MRRNLAFGTLAALGLIACLSMAGGVPGRGQAFPAVGSLVNGKIAYSDPFNLYAVNPDGSGRLRLARCGSNTCRIGPYAWSPAGKRLAFLRENRIARTGPSNVSLFVVQADGRRARRLAGCGKPKWSSCGDLVGSRLSWSPDGSRLVVTRRGSLLVVNVDRGGFRRLTTCGPPASCSDANPSWEPHGARIVFARAEASRPRSLYSVRSDGSDLRQLTHLPGYASNPDWSDDGSRIAFDVSGGGEAESDRIYAIASDGSTLTLLSAGPKGSGPGRPAWSLDGTQVVFFNTPGTPAAFSSEVVAVRADGTQRRRLYQGLCCVSTWARPIWSPDGKYIAFGVGRIDGEDSGIFVMREDGSGLRTLASESAEVSWQRKP